MALMFRRDYRLAHPPEKKPPGEDPRRTDNGMNHN